MDTTKEHRATIKSFPQAMLDYFGKNGKDSTGFMAELKQLMDADKAEFRELLKEQGYALP